MLIGLAAGLVSGYRGGWLDAFLMRAADAQLTFPAILVAMLLDGVARSVLPRSVHETLGIPVVIGAIALAQWVPFARAARVGTLVEREKGYVQAAQVMARPGWSILLGHVLPNVMGPIVVIATIGLGNAILTEATLSFLGVGIPPTSPSLGTLVRNGSAYLPSGAWWMVVFPGLALAGLVLAVNVAGDGLRDGLDPKQRSTVS
jgi:peptide/nickel transport system permease protein